MISKNIFRTIFEPFELERDLVPALWSVVMSFQITNALFIYIYDTSKYLKEGRGLYANYANLLLLNAVKLKKSLPFANHQNSLP